MTKKNCKGVMAYLYIVSINAKCDLFLLFYAGKILIVVWISWEAFAEVTKLHSKLIACPCQWGQ